MIVPAAQSILHSPEWICLNLIKSSSVFPTHPFCRRGCSTQQLSQGLIGVHMVFGRNQKSPGATEETPRQGLGKPCRRTMLQCNMMVTWHQLLGGVSQLGSPQTEAPKSVRASRGRNLKAICPPLQPLCLLGGGELLKDAYPQQPRSASCPPPPRIFSTGRTKRGESWSWKLQCLLALDSWNTGAEGCSNSYHLQIDVEEGFISKHIINLFVFRTCFPSQVGWIRSHSNGVTQV